MYSQDDETADSLSQRTLGRERLIVKHRPARNHLKLSKGSHWKCGSYEAPTLKPRGENLHTLGRVLQEKIKRGLKGRQF